MYVCTHVHRESDDATCKREISGEHEAKRIGSINPVIVKIPFFTLQLQCWQLRWCSKRANNFARIDFLPPIEGTKKTLLLLIWMSSSSSIWRIESSTLYLHFIYDVAHQQRWLGENISVNSCQWRRASYTHNFYREKNLNLNDLSSSKMLRFVAFKLAAKKYSPTHCCHRHHRLESTREAAKLPRRKGRMMWNHEEGIWFPFEMDFLSSIFFLLSLLLREY